jgi:acyl carrier protein
MSTETNIERLILDELLSGKGRTKIEPEESLIKSGILDSLALLRLVVLIEQHFGVTVGDGELIPDNFETISRIKAFLDRKQQKK